jgi:hypothetical protein
MPSSETGTLVWSLARALFGEVHETLRVAIVLRERDGYVFKFLYDGEISEDMRESASCAGTGFLADLPGEPAFREDIERLDAPGALPLRAGLVVYARKELERTESREILNGIASEQAEVANWATGGHGECLAAMSYALLGEVWQGLRQVSYVVEGGVLVIRFVNDGRIEPDMVASAHTVVSRLSGRVPEGTRVTHEFLVVEAPERIPRNIGWVAFARWEGW